VPETAELKSAGLQSAVPEQVPMVVDEVLISVAPGETRAAFLQHGQLQRLVVDRGTLRVGALFLGRVINVVPALDAAFVDIGVGDAGFLGLAEARPAAAAGGTIKQFVNEGDRVLVQVIRAPIEGKGPKLTLRPALAGAHLVLLPHGTGISVSMEAAVTADVLAALEAVLPRDAGGWTLLPAAAGASTATILGEARQLCASWQELRMRSRPAKPPLALAAGPDPVVVALSEEWTPALARVAVDEPRAAARLRAAFPDRAGRIETGLSRGSLFSDHDVEEQIEALLAPEVSLRCGGTVSIAETAAVVAIDVDAGAADQGGREATALAVNREAADMIARHLCLRDLAGHVVIDFVPMRRRGNQRRLLEHLRRAFVRRRAAVDLAGFTRLGLIELTRRRAGPSVAETMLAPCRPCAGRGAVLSPLTVALKALRQLVAEDRAAPGRRWTIEAAPQVIAAFAGAALEARRETEARLGRPLRLHASERQTADSYKLMANSDREGCDGREG
jgi:ribonuclease G